MGKELLVDLPEVNAGGKQPPGMKEVAAEFGIIKGKNGAYKAYNMTLPGGIPMTREGLEHREVHGSHAFQGTVDMYNWRRGWGFIKASPGVVLPPVVTARVKELEDDATKRGTQQQQAESGLYFRKEDIAPCIAQTLEEGQQVSFKVYTDDKGAGACEINY